LLQVLRVLDKNGGDDNLKKAFPELLSFSVENTTNLTRQDAEIVLGGAAQSPSAGV
jgi:hypothetical protein